MQPEMCFCITSLCCVPYSWLFFRTIHCCTSRQGNRVAFDFKEMWLSSMKVTIFWRRSVIYTALKLLALRFQICLICGSSAAKVILIFIIFNAVVTRRNIHFQQNIWCPRDTTYLTSAPCRLRGCKNGPAPFPGRMSYKATKPGPVSVLYLSMFLLCWCLLGPLFMYC